MKPICDNLNVSTELMDDTFARGEREKMRKKREGVVINTSCFDISLRDQTDA